MSQHFPVWFTFVKACIYAFWNLIRLTHIIFQICWYYFILSVDQFDREPPVIQNCPNDIMITAPAGSTVANAFWQEPTATDNDNMLPSRTRSHAPGSTFSVGSTLVTYTFTDSSNNEAMCTFNVNVSRKFDLFVRMSTIFNNIYLNHWHMC